jgi:hypothetical protein
MATLFMPFNISGGWLGTVTLVIQLPIHLDIVWLCRTSRSDHPLKTTELMNAPPIELALP